MQSLYVWRHAKAVTWTPTIEDFSRKLQAVGLRHARSVAAWMCEHLEMPESIVCSPSQRTRETLAPLLSQQAGLEAATHFLPQIYMANLRTLTGLLDAAFAEVNRVLIVGHNPGLEVLIGHAVHSRHYSEFHRLPTGTLAVIDFETAWAEDQGRGVLKHLVRGKHLPPV
jgi:phosphohistidine phosphatase SixA